VSLSGDGANEQGGRSKSRLGHFLVLLPSRVERFVQPVLRGIHILRTSGVEELIRRLRRRWLASSRVAEGVAARIIAASAPPIVSIIIPAHNGLRYTEQCVRSLFDSTVRATFEVIVVDNGSSDGTSRWLRQAAKRHPTLHHIRNRNNLGFGRAVNQGARMAHGKYVLIANNDIIVTPGWLDRLVATAESQADIGVVSPVTNYVGEGPQVDLRSASLQPPGAPGYAEALLREPRPPFQVPDRLVFFCVLVKRHVFEFLGGLSEAFGLGNFEDDDFCLRARLAGYSLFIDPSVFIFHYGSRTFAEQRINHKRLMAKNYHTFFGRVAALSVQKPTSGVRRDAQPIASVVVRTMNRPPLLRDALASLANQTFRSFEVIVVNDAGNDVAPIVAEFADQITIRYIQHPRQRGRSAALNSGAQAARGTWITYLDDDDIFYPTHLDVLANALQRTPDVRVAYSDANHSLSLALGEGERVVLRERRQSFEFDPTELLVRNHIPILTLAHAVSCFGQVGWFDEELQEFEDWDFVIRLAQATPFLHVHRITCEYRWRVSREVMATLPARRRSAMEAMQYIYARYPVEHRALKARRAYSTEAMKREVEDLTRIMATPYTEEKRALLSAARVYSLFLSDTLADGPAQLRE